MGYSQKTDNYELPQYLADDRPSYLGDWNEAMNKLDTGMNDNKKDITDVDNKVFNVTQRLQTTEDNMSNVTQIAEEAVSTAANALARFPIDSNDMKSGAVTAPKLDDTAIQSVLSGLRVRRFDSRDAQADNEGLVCPAGVNLQGFYMPDINVLVINRYSYGDTFSATPVESNPQIYLPSYIPRATWNIDFGKGVLYNSTEDFFSWSAIMYLPNGAFGIRSPRANTGFDMFGAFIIPLTGQSTGRSVNNVNDYISENGVL